MSRLRLAAGLLLGVLGTAVVVAGIALIYPPAALIVGGAACSGFGLLAIDVETRKKR